MKSIGIALAVMIFAGAVQGQSTRITVIDATTREPLIGAVVLTGEDREALLIGRDGPGQTRVAGAAGVFEVRPIGPAGTVQARVSAEGHASILVDYPQGAPREVTVALPRAMRVGGVVVDEKGQPVKGAALRLIAFADDLPRFQITGEWMKAVTTDDQGRFSFETASEKTSSIMIRSDDTRFAPQMINSGEAGPDVAAFKAGTARVVLREGLPIMGIVVDEQDRPVAGAQVLTGSSHEPETLRQTTTDAVGRFRMEQVFTAEVPQFGVTARVPGKSAGVGLIPAAQRENFRIKLSPVRTVSGKVVDLQGRPVRATVVAVASGASGRIAFDPQVQTDADGAFSIAELPSGDLQFSASAPGYQHLISGTVAPGPVTLTLRQLPTQIRLTGTVVDDETGAPIPAFEVAAGTQFAANQPLYANRRERISATNGVFEVLPNEIRESFAYFVRVEAPGYAHFVPTPIKASELPADRVVKFDIRLKRADPIRGTVVDSDGKPAVGARVTLGVQTAEAWMSNEPSQSDKANIWTVTDARGEFQLPSQGDKDFTLIAANDRGVGLAKHSDPKVAGGYAVKIDRHWGRIEGRYYRAGQPVKGGIINAQLASLDLPPFVVFNVNGVADDQGRFAFNQVIPGRQRMSLRPGYQTSDGFQNVSVDVLPDETKQLEIGTSGRTVKGKLEISARGQVEWFAYIDRIGPPVNLPEGFNASLDVAREFLQKLRQDAEFAQWRAEQQSETPARGIRISISPDGSFQYGLLAPGFYRLIARASEPAPQSNVRQAGAQIGEVQYGLAIPAEPGGVIDLQAIPLKITSTLRTGDPVPAVEGKLLDGTPFSMAALKGKYVVINFWATWCGPCKFEMPAVKAIHDEFSKRGDVVVVGMCLDETIPPAVAYAAENQYAWQHVFLGNWQATDIPEKFGVRGIPTTVLVGPDGKVIAASAQPAEVHRGLTELLSKPK